MVSDVELRKIPRSLGVTSVFISHFHAIATPNVLWCRNLSGSDQKMADQLATLAPGTHRKQLACVMILPGLCWSQLVDLNLGPAVYEFRAVCFQLFLRVTLRPIVRTRYTWEHSETCRNESRSRSRDPVERASRHDVTSRILVCASPQIVVP